MTSKLATLPLGVDIGQRRVRVALTAKTGGGPPKLLAVAAHDHDGDPVEAMRWAIEDLQTQERRCVLALAPPDALLCTAEFPAMSPWERVNAARFEAARFVGYPIGEAAVSLVRTNTPACWAIGAVRRDALDNALGIAKRARLRPLAVDDAAFALRRSHPDAGAVIDVGSEATRLTVFGATIPYTVRIPIGGEAMTDAIAQSLGVDAGTAENRKRNVGFGGAGEAPRDTLITALAEAFADARARGYDGIHPVVLCGNGSRIPGFGSAIERATGYAAVPATLPPDCSETLPPDVLRAAAPDWSLAYGLSLWSIAS